MSQVTRPTRRDVIRAAAAMSAAALMPLPGKAASGLPGSAPVSVARVGLLARDAPQLAAWYEKVVGLQILSSSGASTSLGVAGVPLLEIIAAPSVSIAPQDQAGLFHTAFLLPSRADLARWVVRAAQARFPIDGASDHLVSEAIYLTDPEGNGVEIYADRPADTWTWKDGQVEMATLRLDFDGLLAPAGRAQPWTGAPAGTVVGHVHLKVGDAAKGAEWWRETLQLSQVRARRGAVFLSTGGYHHHVAVNEWQSAGAGPRARGLTGLAYVELSSRVHSRPHTHEDLWGTEVRVTPVA